MAISSAVGLVSLYLAVSPPLLYLSLPSFLRVSLSYCWHFSAESSLSYRFLSRLSLLIFIPLPLTSLSRPVQLACFLLF